MNASNTFYNKCTYDQSHLQLFCPPYNGKMVLQNWFKSTHYYYRNENYFIYYCIVNSRSQSMPMILKWSVTNIVQLLYYIQVWMHKSTVIILLKYINKIQHCFFLKSRIVSIKKSNSYSSLL